MPLPFAHHVRRARASPIRIASHSEDDLLRERDPDLLVVHELVVALQLLDGRGARGTVEIGLESETVPLPHAPVALRAELGPGPKEGEIDVEQDSSEHILRIGRCKI